MTRIEHLKSIGETNDKMQVIDGYATDIMDSVFAGIEQKAKKDESSGNLSRSFSIRAKAKIKDEKMIKR